MKFTLPMFVLLLAAMESRMYKSMMTIPKFKKGVSFTALEDVAASKSQVRWNEIMKTK
jgi:hypothetical protein